MMGDMGDLLTCPTKPSPSRVTGSISANPTLRTQHRVFLVILSLLGELTKISVIK